MTGDLGYGEMLDEGPEPQEEPESPRNETAPADAEVATVSERDDLAAPSDLRPVDVGQAWKLANAMAASKVVPKSLQKDPQSCFLIVMDAMHRGVNPVVHAQSRYVIHGGMGMSAQAIIAAVNATGRFVGIPRFTWKGEGDDLTCTCSAVERVTKEEFSYTFHLKTAVASGWTYKSDPYKHEADVMCAYRAVTRFASLYCPEAVIGIDALEGHAVNNDISMDEARAAEITAAYSNPT